MLHEAQDFLLTILFRTVFPKTNTSIAGGDNKKNTWRT
jgi:hypothetical protein